MADIDHKTAVLGYFGYQNAGDDAFYDFWMQSMGAPSTALSRNLTDKTARSAILGGGAIVNDYFISRLPASFTSLSLYGCSLPYGSDDVNLLKPLLDKIDDVHLRSKRDVEAAKAILPQAQYVPDLIFGHNFEDREISIEEIVSHCEVPPASFKAERKNLFLFLSDHYRATELGRHYVVESFKFKLAQSVDYLSQFYNVICIPMSMWHDSRDNVFAADVVSRMKHRAKVAVVDRYLGPSYIFQAIKSQAALVVTMKYHGIVFSMNANVPFINIGDTRKNADLLLDSGLDGLNCSLSHFENGTFLKAVKYAESAEVREIVSSVATENHLLVQEALKAIRLKLDFSPL